MHVDRASAKLYGPGRVHLKFRISVNGRLAGRGGRCGCSLGFGGNNLPAVALIGPGVALTVDDVFEGPAPIVELWTVAGGAATARGAPLVTARKAGSAR